MRIKSETFSFSTEDSEVAADNGYHRGLLIVGLRPEAVRFAAVSAFSTLAVTAADSPGLTALHQLERTGAIRQVIPLGPSQDSSPQFLANRGAVGTMAASIGAPEHSSPNAGVSIIEVSRMPSPNSYSSPSPRIPSSSSCRRYRSATWPAGAPSPVPLLQAL